MTDFVGVEGQRRNKKKKKKKKKRMEKVRKEYS